MARPTLQTINDELQLYWAPVKTIKKLRTNPHFKKDLTITSMDNLLRDISDDVFEIIAEQYAEELILTIHGALRL